MWPCGLLCGSCGHHLKPVCNLNRILKAVNNQNEVMPVASPDSSLCCDNDIIIIFNGSCIGLFSDDV